MAGSEHAEGGYKEISSILLTNSALRYEPKCGGREGVAGSQPTSAYFGSNSIFNVWEQVRKTGSRHVKEARSLTLKYQQQKKIKAMIKEDYEWRSAQFHSMTHLLMDIFSFFTRLCAICVKVCKIRYFS